MTYWYNTPNQRSCNFSIYSKAKKISEIGPALARVNSVFPDTIKDGEMVHVCKKQRSSGDMQLHGIYEYSDGVLTKQNDFMVTMFGGL